MPTERITFAGHDGGQLAARLDLPDGPVLATALFAHCFTCSKDIPAARRIAARLAAMGIAVLRFDFTGLGHSQGEFENTTFTTNVQDLISAAHYLAGRNMAPDQLIGHSLGGAAVLRAKDCVMQAVTNVREDAEDVYADARDINERRAAEEDAEVIEDASEEKADEE